MALIEIPPVDLSEADECGMPYSDVSVPELARRIETEAHNAERRHNELRADIREDIAALRTALQEAQQGLVTKVEYRLELTVMEKRVMALEAAAQKQADIAERRRLTAVTSVVAPILVAILVAWLLNRGVVVQ